MLCARRVVARRWRCRRAKPAAALPLVVPPRQQAHLYMFKRGWLAAFRCRLVAFALLRRGVPRPAPRRSGGPRPFSLPPLPLVAPPNYVGGFGRAVVARGAPFFVGCRRHRPSALLAFRSHVRLPWPAGRVVASSRACCSSLASDSLRAPSPALWPRLRVRRVRRFRSVRTRVPLGGFRINGAFSTFLIFLEPFFSSATVFQKNKKK